MSAPERRRAQDYRQSVQTAAFNLAIKARSIIGIASQETSPGVLIEQFRRLRAESLVGLYAAVQAEVLGDGMDWPTAAKFLGLNELDARRLYGAAEDVPPLGAPVDTIMEWYDRSYPAAEGPGSAEPDPSSLPPTTPEASSLAL